MPFKKILLFLSFIFICRYAFSLDLFSFFLNPSSIDDSNSNEIKITYQCQKTTSGLLTLLEFHLDNENKACATLEQKTWYKAKEYCEKRNLEFNEISRSTKNSPLIDLTCSNESYCSSRVRGEILETEIKFICSIYPDKPIKDSERDREREFFRQLEEEKQRENSRPQGMIRTPHNGKNNNEEQNTSFLKSVWLECNANTREIIEIDQEQYKLFNTSNLTRIEMFYDRQNKIIQSQDLKAFRFHNILTRHLKFSHDISDQSSRFTNISIFDDKNKQIKTQCLFK